MQGANCTYKALCALALPLTAKHFDAQLIYNLKTSYPKHAGLRDGTAKDTAGHYLADQQPPNAPSTTWDNNEPLRGRASAHNVNRSWTV